MATIKTVTRVSNPDWLGQFRRGGLTDLQPLDAATFETHGFDPEAGPSVPYINSGCREREEVSGVDRPADPGEDVVVHVHATAAGLLFLDESTDDGGTWIRAATFAVVGGALGALRFTPTAGGAPTRYRLTFRADQAAKQVTVSVQHRT